jgi:hypothetical protein
MYSTDGSDGAKCFQRCVPEECILGVHLQVLFGKQCVLAVLCGRIIVQCFTEDVQQISIAVEPISSCNKCCQLCLLLLCRLDYPVQCAFKAYAESTGYADAQSIMTATVGAVVS